MYELRFLFHKNWKFLCSIKLILDFKNRVYSLLISNGALLMTYPEQEEKITKIMLSEGTANMSNFRLFFH